LGFIFSENDPQRQSFTMGPPGTEPVFPMYDIIDTRHCFPPEAAKTDRLLSELARTLIRTSFGPGRGSSLDRSTIPSTLPKRSMR
jgi:hypothetical protein